MTAGTAGTAGRERSDLRSSGERIEALLEASSANGPLARERAEELVRLVVELYGAGLERVLEIVYDAGRMDDAVLERLADDELVASLLLVHGLHPYGVQDRVEQALAQVRPYLGSHGGDVELLDVTDDGVVRLRMLGSCDGCASSSLTLKLAVEGAIEAAAPEVVRIEVAAGAEAPGAGSVIPVESLTARLHPVTDAADPVGAPVWEPVEGLDDLPAGGIRRVAVAGLDVVVCRVGAERYAYRDACPSCATSLADASIERGLGAPRGSAVLTCRVCRSHYDVQRAGRGLDGTDLHLDPLPLLERDGVVRIAVPARVPA